MFRLLLILALTAPLFGALPVGAATMPLPVGAPLRPLADSLAIWPATQNVSVGAAFTLQVRITGSDPVVAADIYITFDPTKVDITQVTNSGPLPTISEAHDLAHGKILIGVGSLGATSTPPFTLLTITGRAKATPGPAYFNFNPEVTDVQGINGSVRGSLINGSVEIRLVPTPTRTSTVTLTPTPTRTPTVTMTPTPTRTPTITPTPTQTHTPTITPTPSNTPTATSTPTPQPGQLCVLAFDDLNGNWLRDSGEPLLAGARLTVRDVAFAQIGQHTTDGIHEPKCFALAPGAYYLDEVDPPGYTSRAPNWWSVVIASQMSLAVAFADERGSGTPTPTPSATATVSPTLTASVTPDALGTATSTPTLTDGPRPTATATASRTPTRPPVMGPYLPLILGSFAR